tara:strand:+ start:52 stop:843 length:792 start_codon:yes stop_codon:yes gene_type:complete
MTGRLNDKVALVTGAGSIAPGWGNGKATAVLFAREGAKVLLVDINADAAGETKAIIDGEGGEAIVCVADVADEAACAAMVQACLDAYGRIDVLHNNVGIVEPGGPEQIAEANWDRLIDINVKSMYLTCRAALPHMVARGGGAIVNLSSIASFYSLGYPCVSYAASKGAINALTRNIAVQYAPKGIRCNAILPGLMNTPLVMASVAQAYDDVDKIVAERDALCPLGHMGDAWDTAHAALFLASDDARYITGIELVVDGGITLTM